jgi:hypothetical protein
MIQSSTYTEGAAQADGRRYVKETHTDDTGKTYEFEWLGSQDAGAVLAARAEALSALITTQREAEALVLGTRLPLTKLQFERRFSNDEWAAIQAFNAGYDQHPALDDAQKLPIKRGLSEYALALDIALTDPGTVALVGLYEALGLLASGRAAEILQ